MRFIVQVAEKPPQSSRIDVKKSGIANALANGVPADDPIRANQMNWIAVHLTFSVDIVLFAIQATVCV